MNEMLIYGAILERKSNWNGYENVPHKSDFREIWMKQNLNKISDSKKLPKDLKKKSKPNAIKISIRQNPSALNLHLRIIRW